MGNSSRTGHSGGSPGSVLSGLAVAVGCVLFLGAFVWGAVLYQPYMVPTDSMDPTVKAGDRVLAERIDGEEVRRGDVVVFQDGGWGDVPMVKRVAGVGGDKVSCCGGGGLTVNGKPVKEPYLRAEDARSQAPFDARVPEDSLFLLGDNRTDSLDSREHMQEQGGGGVPRSAVQARVDAVVWPAGEFGLLPEPAGFRTLPGGVSEPGPLRPLAVAAVAGAALILGGAAHGPLTRRKAPVPASRAGRG